MTILLTIQLCNNKTINLKDPKMAGSLGTIKTQKDVIALALSNLNTFSLTDYLLKIYKHLGATVYQNVVNAVGGNIVVKKEMVLDELHIYGSSRHGIHKPGVQLLVKSYQLNRLDSATDSTQAQLSYKYFKRTLTYKQYELTNHLGNVLAIVLDRKTFVGDDTLEYYQADVYNAGLYYAFGSSMEGEFTWTIHNVSRTQVELSLLNHGIARDKQTAQWITVMNQCYSFLKNQSSSVILNYANYHINEYDWSWLNQDIGDLDKDYGVIDVKNKIK